MIKKIKSIGNLAVFKSFDWDKEVLNNSGSVQNFQAINILYGRNYSGKTTLSRILRAMESGELSQKFENPDFNVVFSDGTSVTQGDMTDHSKKIRVFNEDFVRDNLRFITDPDESIEPFAILGEDNSRIEKEIKELEGELGSSEEGKETALYAKLTEARKEYDEAKRNHEKAKSVLEKQLSDKATDRKIGIKYKPERFGDQNYNTPKLKSDIKKVYGEDYQSPTEEELLQYESLIGEKTLDPLPEFRMPSLNFASLSGEAEVLVTKKISESDKLEALVKDAVLNRWVSEGRGHHKDKRDSCAFCGNIITEERWLKLDRHFDRESDQLEKDIDALIGEIESEKNTVASALSIDKSQFYSKFHQCLDNLERLFNNVLDQFSSSLDSLISQLKARKNDIINSKLFESPEDVSSNLTEILESYGAIGEESNNFSVSFGKEQIKAREVLRLKEISEYLFAIKYQDQVSDVEEKKSLLDSVERNGKQIKEDISKKEKLISEKKRNMNDEEKGAIKVNEYLNNFFGHQFLSLEAQKEDIPEEGAKRVRFEVIRDDKKAYHLSEGERSLLAFCYFLAKLDDIDTRGSKSIIWIDDPISSLDGNHIFFIYSLLSAEVVSSGRFEQLFVSTHNLNFLKYLKRLPGGYVDGNGQWRKYKIEYFHVVRKGKISRISIMPKYLREYVTEFNYLFHQIYKCSIVDCVNDSNYIEFYSFGNNARKFLEIYLYYKYPDQRSDMEKLRLFFGENDVPPILTDRVNNEYSHLSGAFERGATPVEEPEMLSTAKKIIEKLKDDSDQYNAFLKSIGIEEEV